MPTSKPASITLQDIAAHFGIKPAKDRDLGETVLAVTAAIKSERDHLKAKLQHGGRNASKTKSIVASRQTPQDDPDIAKRMAASANGEGDGTPAI